jgi:hypothetical protein
MTTSTNNLLATLSSDPEYQGLANLFGPMAPALGRLAVEAAVQTLQSLASHDPALGLEILRENSTDTEWQAIAAALADEANQAVLHQLQNEQELKDILWKLAVAALAALVPMVIP